MSLRDDLVTTLAKFGPSGEHWIRHAWFLSEPAPEDWPKGITVQDAVESNECLFALDAACGALVDAWAIRNGRTFAEVKAIFDMAIANAL